MDSYMRARASALGPVCFDDGPAPLLGGQPLAVELCGTPLRLGAGGNPLDRADPGEGVAPDRIAVPEAAGPALNLEQAALDPDRCFGSLQGFGLAFVQSD